ncbi:hypothetical protein [Tunturiibacter psychrotolerans]|uniref:hypothetical protein n=1 Tax=Tunturiibacter psychrotolerans TaxID=3069686 RepID=UPI003D23EC08
MSLGLDRPIEKVQKITLDSAREMKGGRSLRVDENTMIAFCMGQPEAVATVEAWRFQENRGTKIVVVSPEQYEHLATRNQVVFGG